MTGRRSLVVTSALALALVAGTAVADPPGVTNHGNGLYSARGQYLGVTAPVSSLGEAVPEPAKTSRLFKLFGPGPFEILNPARPIKRESKETAESPNAFSLELSLPTFPTAAPTLGPVYEGNNNAQNGVAFGFTVSPPDTVGAIGPTHYVQMTNLLVGIYNRSTGALVGSRFKLSSLFGSIPGANACKDSDDGDPIPLYDKLADRWILTQFGVANDPVNFQCFAVSTGPDPTGTYYAYAFPSPNAKFPDYPKIGTWPDGYYMTVNQFFPGFDHTGVYAYERAKMLNGDPTASYIYFDTEILFPADFIGGLLPSDFDGQTPPPAGRKNVMAYFTATEFVDPADGLRLFEMTPNYATPGSSTFVEVQTTYPAPMVVAPFNPLDVPNTRADIPQFGGAGLQSLGDRLMHRLQYRNFGTHETYAVTHSVNVSGSTTFPNYRAGIRLYEIRRNPGTGVFSLYDQIEFSHATRSMWMGSAAIDGSGRLAVGYSGSSTTERTSIRIIGRDSATQTAVPPALGTLPAADEVVVHTSAGSSTSSNRWGDYSALTVDPLDDCTFWYTNEYVNVSGGNAWDTKFHSFRYPGCVNAQLGTVNGTITNCAGGAPIPGAMVTFTGGPMDGFSTTTIANGTYSRTLTPGNYTVTATAPNYAPAVGNAVVTNGGTVTVNLCLIGTPVLTPGSGTVTAEFCLPLNNAIDPSEVVQVSLCVSNTGGANTVNLVGTLQTGGGVAVAGAPQNYGVVLAGGPAVCRTFDLTAAAVACGSLITASVQFQDGATNLGTFGYDFTAGQLLVQTRLGENFDSVTPPALPAGWVAVNALGGGQLWISDPFNPRSAPNSVFVDDPASVADKRITSPTFTYTTTMAQLSFWHDFSLETGFDGGVLEISTDGGAAFNDILAAGGSFALNGYTHTLGSGFSTPLPNRQVWSGSSGGYINTIVNLPAAGMNLPVQLRWRMGSDNSVAGVSWDLDDVLVTDTTLICATGPCFTPNDVVVLKTGPAGGVATGGRPMTYTITVINPGPGTLSSVEMRDPLPSTARIMPGAGSVRIPFGWSCTTPYPGTSGLIRCTIPALAPNLASPAIFGFTVMAPPLCSPAGPPRTINLSNTAFLSFLGGADPNPGNNTSTVTTLVTGPPCFF